MKNLFAATMLALGFVGISALAQTPNKASEKETNRFGTPIPGVEVSLEQEPGVVVKTVRTDADGNFEFSHLKPGLYRIKSGFTVATPRDPATGQASGKQVQSSATTSTVHSPRDVATGQASGKRVATTGSENTESGVNAEANRATINTSRSNIKNQRVAAEIVVGDEDDASPSIKTGVNTSRSNIRNRQGEALAESTEDVVAVQLFSDETPAAKRAFVLPHVLEKSGLTVEVTASGRIVGNVLKTRHDTVKNSINNVR